jgi:hypothetical protein
MVGVCSCPVCNKYADMRMECVNVRIFIIIKQYMKRWLKEAIQWFRAQENLSSRSYEMQGGGFRRSGGALVTEEVRCKRRLSHICLPRPDGFLHYLHMIVIEGRPKDHKVSAQASYFLANMYCIILQISIKHSWSNGRIIAFQAIGPGSTPGGCTTSFSNDCNSCELSFL